MTINTRRIFAVCLAALVFLLQLQGASAQEINPNGGQPGALLSAAANDEIHYTVMGSPASGLTAVAVDWRGPDSQISYGLTTAYGQSVTAATPSIRPFSSAGPFWQTRISGLLPNTVYHFHIGSEAVDHTFKTAPLLGTAMVQVDVIADVGDTSSYPNVGKVADLIQIDQPDLVLVPGDISYANPHGQKAVDQHFNDVMKWSANGAAFSAAYMIAWGNHEWDSSSKDDLRNYKGRFDLPNPQSSPGSPAVSCCGEDWYWFDYGNVRFIAYPEPWSGAFSDWKTKASAIMDSAQANANIQFIVTFGHRPAYSSGHHPGDDTLAGYMATLQSTHNKYVLNLNGHSHNYERTTPQNGVVHITAGTGGASLEQDNGGSACGRIWLTCPAPAYSAKRYMHQGVLRLKFFATSIQGDFLCGPPGGGKNDITCSQGDSIDRFVIGNSATVANAQSVTAVKNTPKAITLTGTGANGASITYTVVDGPSHGTLSGAAPTLTYTPPANYSGSDSFTFKVNDTKVDSNIATVSITVQPVKSASIFLFMPTILR